MSSFKKTYLWTYFCVWEVDILEYEYAKGKITDFHSIFFLDSQFLFKIGSFIFQN